MVNFIQTRKNFFQIFLIVAFGIILSFFLVIPVTIDAASIDPLAARLKGRILLQVESKGEAWYVNPVDGQRHYLGRPYDAVEVMRKTGLGVSNKDFESFNGRAPQRLAGRILLKVEDHGEAYYANPKDLTLHYLSPADAWNLMRTFGLGISNKNLEKITPSSLGSNQPSVNYQTQLGSAAQNFPLVSLDNKDITSQVQYVVQIVCPANGGTSSGSGVIIFGGASTDSKVVTNKHVVASATGPCGVYRTTNYENQPALFFKSGAFFILSTNYDLAELIPDVKTIPTYTNANVSFSRTDSLLNSDLYILGYPPFAGRNITLTKGIVAGSENIDSITMIKTDAKIDSGNSGGAVFNGSGHFIGIPTLASQGNFSSYGYIIPAIVVKSFIDLVELEGYGKQNWQASGLTIYSVNQSNTVPSPSPPPANPLPQQPSQDSLLKIARCQADARVQTDAYINKGYKMAEDAILPRIAELEAEILRLENIMADSILKQKTLSGLPMTPSDETNAMTWLGHLYDPVIAQYRAGILDWKNKLQQTKDEAKRLFEQGYNDLYLKCLNS